MEMRTGETVTFLDRLLSDRRRGLKLFVSGILALAVGFGFAAWPRERKPSFTEIIADPASWPGAVVGPEHLRARGADRGEAVFEQYGTSLRFVFPAGPGGEGMRAEAGEVGEGGYASVTARHLEGLRFEMVRIEADPFRKWKLAISGAAAVSIAALLPVFYGVSRRGLRPRGAGGGEGERGR